MASFILFALLAQALPADTPAKPLGNTGAFVQRGDYPIVALIDDVEGVTGFTLDVGADGSVRKCAVTASSGSALLDHATCASIKQRARFAPATRGGAPVPGQWKSRVRWMISGKHMLVDPRFDGPARTAATANDAFRSFSFDSVLRESGQAQQAATTFVVADVDRGGTVTACRLDGGTTGASHAALACSLLAGKDLFVPGFDRDGNAQADRVRVKIRW